MAGAGVNGLAVGLMTGGGLLLWAGIRNVTVADSLRDVLSMENAGAPISVPFGQVVSGLGAYTGDVDGGNTASTAAGNAAAGSLVAAVRSQIGKPYRWSATGPDAFDCSGLVYWALKSSGYPDVPRFTTATFGGWAKSNGFTKITDASQFAAGDIVVKAGHMGVCSGPGTMIDAPHTGAYVREEALWKPLVQWWGWRVGRGVLTAPIGKRQPVPTTPQEQQREQRRAAG